MGQAAGTAAALYVRNAQLPRDLASGESLRELQEILMDDDCWLPTKARPVGKLATSARICGEGDVMALIDGHDRALADDDHAWVGKPEEAVEFHWEKPNWVGGARLTFDSNLANEKRMPSTYPQKGDRCLIPASLVKDFRLEMLDENGNWASSSPYYRQLSTSGADKTWLQDTRFALGSRIYMGNGASESFCI